MILHFFIFFFYFFFLAFVRELVRKHAIPQMRQNGSCQIVDGVTNSLDSNANRVLGLWVLDFEGLCGFWGVGLVGNWRVPYMGGNIDSNML